MGRNDSVVERRVFTETLHKAINLLDSALDALIKEDNKALDESVWRASFYLEYLTFILSLGVNGNNSFGWKRIKGKADLRSSLESARNLLIEALDLDSIEEEYRKIWIARGLVLSFQLKLERMKSRKQRRQWPGQSPL